MKKLLIFLIIIVGLGFLGLNYATNRIHDEVTSEDLPEQVYDGDQTPEQGIESTLMAMLNINNNNDEYDLVETFINYVIYDSIKKNINEEYDPLSDCDTTACQTIVSTNHGAVRYAYAHLNDDNQLLVTTSIHRDRYPSFDTALHFVFDIDIEIDIIMQTMSLVLTLDSIKLADDTISENFLDRILSYIDIESIEDSVTTGTLDLDEKTYHYHFTYTP